MRTQSQLCQFLAAISILLCSSFASAVEKAAAAHADLVDGSGKKVGTADLLQTTKGVKLVVEVQGLTPGNHGIHIHETGKCDGPDFKTAGGHLNPEHKEHGMNNPKGMHAGDMPNLEVGSSGAGKFQYVDSLVTLENGAPNSLFKDGGTSLVIHAKADDEKTNPAGAAGDRIACGVITKK
jgi:Cu-Zn family superoxide dismutase